MKPPHPQHHTHTHRKGKTIVTIQVKDMVGKPPGQASPQHISFSAVNPTQVLQFVKNPYTHMHTHAHTLSVHPVRSLYCIIKNKGNENIAVILLQQQRSEALRAEKTFSGKFGSRRVQYYEALTPFPHLNSAGQAEPRVCSTSCSWVCGNKFTRHLVRSVFYAHDCMI